MQPENFALETYNLEPLFKLEHSAKTSSTRRMRWETVTRNLIWFWEQLWVCAEIESVKRIGFPECFWSGQDFSSLQFTVGGKLMSWWSRMIRLHEAGSSGFTGTSTFHWLFMKIKAPNIPSHSFLNRILSGIPSSYFNVCIYDKSNLSSLLNDPPDINTFGRPVLYIRTLNSWPIFLFFAHGRMIILIYF